MIYYGKQAYAGFARAFASQLGVNISITDSNSAHVDGKGCISIPGMNKLQTFEEFENTCATIIHETAHVYYKSNAEYQAQAKAKRDRLFMDSLNAVMDVADETGIARKLHVEAGHRRPAGLLLQSNARAWNEHQDKYCTIPSANPIHWQILSTAIIKSRVGDINDPYGSRSTARYAKRIGQALEVNLQASGKKIDMKGVYKILREARGAAPRAIGDHSWLIKLAERLARKLKDVAPPPNQETPGMPMGIPGDGQSNGQPGQGAGVPGNGDPMQAGIDPSAMQPGDVEAGDSEGETFYTSAMLAGVHSNSRGGNSDGGDSETRVYNPFICRTFHPVIKRVADRLASDGDSINRDGGFKTGTSVADPYRIMTDGNCMGKWQNDPHGDGCNVAILLDVSVSMCDILTNVAGIAEAFRLGLSDFAKTACFHFGATVTQKQDFKVLHMEGATRTEKAIRSAHAWLRNLAGRKVIICITDGEAHDGEALAAECNKATTDGVEIMAIALDGGVRLAKNLYSDMPRAKIVTAPDVNRLAIQLGVIVNTL